MQFEHGADFTPAEVSGGLGIALESSYQELFAEVLADGVITAEERTQLERAADNLGLDRQRLLQLEQAMIAAYEAHHRVRIVEHYERGPGSLAVPTGDSTPGQAALLKRIHQLECRVAELEAELSRAQSSINVEVDFSELGLGVDRPSTLPEDCWRRVRRDPANPAAYRDLYRIYGAEGDLDKQWCAAQALVVLDDANPEERALYQRYRSDGLIAPRGGVSPESWTGELLHPEQEVLTGQIFSVIAPAVLIGRLAVLRRDNSLYRARPEQRQDPVRTTITAVRALTWGASILGLAAPAVYVDKEMEGGFTHVPGVPPCTVLGRDVLSGRGALELAFLAGQHLAGYRQEHYVRVLFPAIPDLEDLFLAALSLGNPALPVGYDVKRRVGPIAAAIQPLLDPRQADLLRACYLRFVEEGGRTNLQRWVSAVDRTASRAGLLLCNDLATAVGLQEPREGKLGPLTKDLLVFVVSERYFTLRGSLGITLAEHL